MIESEDARIGIKVPKDEEGNERRYTLTVTDDEGNVMKVPVRTAELKVLFRDWQLNIPAFAVREPMGLLEMDTSISPRELALISSAMNAYYNAGRLNLDWNHEWEEGTEYPETSRDAGYTEEDVSTQ